MEENLKKQIEQSEREMETMKKSFEQKLAEAMAKSRELNKNDAHEKAKKCAHLTNINADPILSGSLKYLVELSAKKSKLIIGSIDKADIQLSGVGVLDRHAAISLQNGSYYLEPFANARLIRNGKQIEDKIQLNNLDRLVFGASLYYIFVDPLKFNIKNEKDFELMNSQINSATVEKIQQEIAEESGLIKDDALKEKNPEEIACFNELIDLMPLIEEANQMSILFDKKMIYRPIILNPIVLGDSYSKAKVI
jgi:hypothetical protein